MNILILPVLVPFLTAVLLALLNGYPRLERAVNLISSWDSPRGVFWLLVQVDQHGIRAMVIGGWFAPWGIAFVADRLACIMLCLSMSVGTLVLALCVLHGRAAAAAVFLLPAVQVLLLGVNWSFITGDLFNLFVAYEVMLIGSYGMMMVGGPAAGPTDSEVHRDQQDRVDALRGLLRSGLRDARHAEHGRHRVALVADSRASGPRS